MKTSVQKVKSLLESKGIKPSVQRLSVLKYVIESKEHPSVEKIYKDLVLSIPTLSKTTVYNTLKQLTSKGLLTAISIDETKVQYDYPEKAHAHFKCLKCGKISDVFIDFSILKNNTIDKLEIVDTQINFKGICEKCQHTGDD